ncbi:hypothetical protein NQT63_00965 [Pseudoalteromonas agarivorans]|uniref:hypothetical protein n=1 Tax=Pseudoalteromonas agarivorans TaxID=176102 RepID=UPI002118FE37|nr:hypothetical protein [Pseudoalteromonas agarivorans]MCQ8884262.1 hypothetical protein [Pseudoalteromonas agarivorans]
MEDSEHNHDIEDWPFECSQNQLAITTKYIMEQTKPVLAILHDDEGDWQVLCDTTNDPDDGMVVCLGCLYTRFPFIGQFASLPNGWEAYRSAENEDWKTSEIEWE